MSTSVRLFYSPLKTKKYRVKFYKNGILYKTIDFGGKGYRDFTLMNNKDNKHYNSNIKDKEAVRQRYIKRHDKENWKDPYTAGSLSRWILWEKPTINEAWEGFKKRFNFT